MKIDLLNNSIVLLANNHNPTLISDSFLCDSHIIKKLDEIDKTLGFIMTPIVTQLQFKNGTSFLLDPQRLKISSKEGEDPYKKAQNYTKALQYIKCKGIGINFDYIVKENDTQNLFKIDGQKDYEIVTIDLRFKHEKGFCNLKINRKDKTTAFFIFNYDYPFDNVIFKDININFINEWKKNKAASYKFIKNYLGVNDA